MSHHLRKKFISASLWSGAISYFYFAFNFLCQVIFARTLSPTIIGIFAFSLASRELISTFCVVGMSGGYIKSSGDQENFNAFMSLTIFACILQFIVALCIASYFAIWESSKITAISIVILSGSQFFILVSYVYMAVLEKKLEYKSIALAQGFGNLLSGLMAIIIAIYFHSIVALIMKDLFAAIYTLILVRRASKTRYTLQSGFSCLKEQFSFGIKCTFYRIAEAVQMRVPEILISSFFGKAALGFFYQGRYLAYFPIKLFQPFTNSVLFSYFATHKDSPTELDKNYWWIMYTISRCLIPITALTYLFGEPVLTFLFGSQWQIAGVCFSYLSLFIFAGTLFSISSNFANLLNKQIYVTQAYVLALVLFCSGIFFTHNIEQTALLFAVSSIFCLLYVTIRFSILGILHHQLAIFYPGILFIMLFGVAHFFQFSLLTKTGVTLFILVSIALAELNWLKKLLREIFFQLPSSTPSSLN